MSSRRQKSRLVDKVPNKWKHFERLVAAIHKIADEGAVVRWDENIDGRQFDVTVRFRKGLYDHLTVIECKNLGRAVSVDKVEGLVTKARDVRANVAVLASTSGFQAGAKDCAKRHGIILLHIKTGTTVDPSLFGLKWGPSAEVTHVVGVTLHYADDTYSQLPSSGNALTYYVQKTVLERKGFRTTIDELIVSRLQSFSESCEYRELRIDLEPGTHIVGPDDGEVPLKEVRFVTLRIAIVEAKSLTGPSSIDPALLSPAIEVENVSTGESTAFDHSSLPLGIGNTFVEGQFYENPSLQFFYYCEKVTSELANVWLIESFQHGKLAQGRFRFEKKFADRYVPVTESAVRKRLRRRLEKMREMVGA